MPDRLLQVGQRTDRCVLVVLPRALIACRAHRSPPLRRRIGGGHGCGPSPAGSSPTSREGSGEADAGSDDGAAFDLILSASAAVRDFSGGASGSCVVSVGGISARVETSRAYSSSSSVGRCLQRRRTALLRAISSYQSLHGPTTLPLSSLLDDAASIFSRSRRQTTSNCVSPPSKKATAYDARTSPGSSPPSYGS